MEISSFVDGPKGKIEDSLNSLHTKRNPARCPTHGHALRVGWELIPSAYLEMHVTGDL